ncbi:MAG: hypothetical protein LBF40_02755 [Deltaproteobacteria bacterium]|nr:hypothetical protein [Deltaproteobacteria bacterium]
MRKIILPIFAGLFLMVMFAACGDSNPFIGEWKCDMERTYSELGPLLKFLSDDNILMVKFKKDSFIWNMQSEDSIEIHISYKRKPDGTWDVCRPDGSKCLNIVFLDKNTIYMPNSYNDVILMRM